MSGRTLALAAALVGLSLVGALVVRGFRAAHLEGAARDAR